MRNHAIDCARALAALLIIAGHTLAFAALPQHWLAFLSHLGSPLFFFLSGVYLSLHESPRVWLCRRLDALLKPYAVVLLAWALAHGFAGKLDWPAYLAGMLYGTGATIVILPLWFLPHLLLALCCARLLLHAGQKLALDTRWYWLPVLALPVLAMPVLSWTVMDGGLPWSADLLLLSMPLVLAGHLLADRVRNVVPSLPLLAAAIVAAWLAVQYGSAAIDMNNRMWAAPLATMVMVAAGIYVLLCLAAWLSGIAAAGNVLAWFGRHSLLVLLFHFLWLRTLFRVLREHGMTLNEGWIAVVTVACVLLCCLTIIVVRRSTVLSRCLLPAVRAGSAAR